MAVAVQAGASDDEPWAVRGLIRRAQFRWDCVARHNGLGFHSPQECLRLPAVAVDLAAECRVECVRLPAQHDVTTPARYPDFRTKEKARALIARFAEGSPPDLLGDADGR